LDLLHLIHSLEECGVEWRSMASNSEEGQGPQRAVVPMMMMMMMNTFTQFWTTGNTALSLFYTLSSSPLYTHYDSRSSLVVSRQRIYQSQWHFKSHMKSSCHNLTHFLSLFCSCQFRRLDLTTLNYSTFTTSLSLLLQVEAEAEADYRQPASTLTPGIGPCWDPWPYICSMSRPLFFPFR
jgi:hypothetical protein